LALEEFRHAFHDRHRRGTPNVKRALVSERVFADQRRGFSARGRAHQE